MNQSNKTLNNNITKLVNQPYKYGFSTTIEKDIIEKGLNEKVIRLLSQKKNEPKFLLEFRLKAYKKWKELKCPEWAQLKFSEIDYQDIVYYSAPKIKKKLNSLDEVDPQLLETFDKLGISLTEQKRLTNVAVDAVFDSVSIATTFKQELAEYGVIFSSILRLHFHEKIYSKFHRFLIRFWEAFGSLGLRFGSQYGSHNPPKSTQNRRPCPCLSCVPLGIRFSSKNCSKVNKAEERRRHFRLGINTIYTLSAC